MKKCKFKIGNFCNCFLISITTVFGVFLFFLLFIQNTLASLHIEKSSYIQVQIDNINYGFFEDNGLTEKLLQNEYLQIKLTRHFVTEPSISLWAKNYSSKKTDGKDIYIIQYSPTGKLLKKYLLKSCYPVSWTLESLANDAFGGFKESVDLYITNIVNEF